MKCSKIRRTHQSLINSHLHPVPCGGPDGFAPPLQFPFQSYNATFLHTGTSSVSPIQHSSQPARLSPCGFIFMGLLILRISFCICTIAAIPSACLRMAFRPCFCVTVCRRVPKTKHTTSMAVVLAHRLGPGKLSEDWPFSAPYSCECR